MNPGWYFCKKQKKLVYDPNHPNVDMGADARTFQLLADLANTWEPKIQMTFEVPSLTGNGRLPVLDLEIFVVNNRVEFSFYKKPIASPFTIMFKSALSKQTKRNSLFQEGLRRLRNCSEGIGWDEKASVLTDYMNCLKWSGYDHEYRVSILTGVLERYDQIKKGY